MRIVTTFAAAAVLAVATLSAHADPFSSIVVFGDSLSDNGNLYKATSGLAPAPPYVNGRFSNGPVAVEQLAAILKVPLLDFAYGGATTGVGNTGDGGSVTSTGFFKLPGITSEVNGALALGLLPDLSKSLVVLWGGANDFEALGDNPSEAASIAAAKTAADNLNKLAGTLKLAGATNILLPNLPDLGKTPEFSGQAVATDFTNTFNAALLPQAGVTLFDTDAVLSDIIDHPGKYPGLSNVTGQCIADKANPACSGYLFFDDIHPTTAADTYLAQDFAAAVTSTAATPEPSSLLLLATGFTGTVGLLRRRKRQAQAA